MKKISVIIPSYNSSATISRTLDELLKQQQDILEEVVIVDSSDDSKTREILKSHRNEKIALVCLDKKTIPAIGRNIGAERAKGEILAFIDSDAYPGEDWLKNIYLAYQHGCQVGGGSILLPESQKRSKLAAAQYFLQFNEFMNVGHKRIKDFVPSCNLFCDKRFFQKVGGFPDIRAAEDVLFGLNANNFSPLYFFPQIKVYHIFREVHADYLRNQEMLGRYILIYRRQRSESWMYKKWIPALLLAPFLAVKFSRIVFRILKSGQPETWRLFAASFPLFIVGLSSWTRGFWKVCWERTEEPKKNEFV